MTIQSLSIIVPCYNEAAVLPAFVERSFALAKKLEPRAVEFVFVNDGSRDDTAAVLNALAARDPRVKVIHFARNRGHQIALTAGMDFASGDMIVTIDADLQDPPELIIDMLREIEAGADVVHARRRRRSGETWFKLATARIFYRLMHIATGGEIVENCGDFRAFNRRVLHVVRSFRESHRFLRALFVHVGFNQCVIDYDRDARCAGETKYPFTRMLRLATDASVSFSTYPIRLIIGFALFSWALTLIYLIKALYEHFVLGITVPGWTSLVVLLTFFAGTILLSIAIVGVYVGRIFEESKGRPLYWVSDMRNLDRHEPESSGRCGREVTLADTRPRAPCTPEER